MNPASVVSCEKNYKFNHLFDIHFTLRKVGVNQN